MLQIRQASLNQLALTLKEKANENYPNIFLFRFVSEQSRKEYFCNLTDLSTTQKRYNLFNLYEGTDIDLPVGEYMYYVYQMEIENENNYNLGFLCEQGKAKVKSNVATVIPTFTQTTIIKQIYE
jgi:hypothetical protein